ncbi:hypothetical protein ACWFRF_15615 [Nocardia sp. NPDC055165]
MIEPVQFAVIKEYLRVGGNYKGISEVTGLAPEQIKEIDKTKYYLDYSKMQKRRKITAILDDADEVIVDPRKDQFDSIFEEGGLQQ